ncbi:lipopolysaccharide/colanic/teichoic acid biosynthesis glycosyltransferase [Paracoccus pantotrophus]|uniref:Lipopolysaccharide/colanic/teichoic acid biosynthesis glycosyltransferase n=2 Tax=Paracoccus pantotrophus TaxID=82367 RepID=A0ABX9SFV4_PARPN|nr:lipopolysaccharide/colanic/teichoic acid biosynthesis glycosyltransferase [Paracoccus pantotrophus]SFO46645.1 Sugar transferase involved in LPS biosynthesis (colanic, teichoic acid) [Paracoccus pantotrophus]
MRAGFEMRHTTDFDIETIDPVLQTAANGNTNQPLGARSLYSRFIKRPLDITAVLLAVPIVVPVVLILALVILWHGEKPFYTQLRVGRSGRSFRLWKLRTMVEDADRRLAEYLAANPEARAEWDLTQKLKNDPRITSTGRFLRKTSLDELPQLWNVLRGDMSIVGPRPMMIEQAPLYPGADYYHLRPGVTGLWQISDRNDSTFAARATFDARYAAELSFSSDVAIIARTVGVVLRCTGY